MVDPKIAGKWDTSNLIHSDTSYTILWNNLFVYFLLH